MTTQAGVKPTHSPMVGNVPDGDSANNPYRISAAASVASLSDDQLRRMDRNGLVNVVRRMETSMPNPDCASQLRFMSRERRHQLASLARRCCRLQNGYSSHSFTRQAVN